MIHYPGTYKRALAVVKVNIKIVLTLLSCTALSFGNIGCSQSEVLAGTPERPKAKPLVVTKKDKPEPFIPVVEEVKKITQEEVEYKPPFEPRANPFVLRENKNSSKKIAVNAIRATDIKLLGLMKDGQNSLAALEIRGRREIVYVGSRLGSSEGVSEIRVLQIHDSDIVIEQGGKQIIISMSIPR